MRNPLKRLARRDPDKPSLKERLASAKERYARTLRVHRALNAPAAAAPAVSRVALTNYATFLYHERRAVCAELYPHLGRDADRFVVGLNEAWTFFFTGSNDWTPRRGTPAASTRAVKVLDLVGIDWRRDGSEADLDRQSGGDYRDTGERPALPEGWPAPDAALLGALDDLQRLDAAQDAMHDTGLGCREADQVPGYAELEAARDDALERLAEERAETLTGLQAKARALLTSSVGDQGTWPNGVNAWDEIARSLARDLLGMPASGIAIRPDPIFAAIDEARRCNAPMHALLKTVPTSAEGCKALARFARDVIASRGGDWPDGAAQVLALIARSPAL